MHGTPSLFGTAYTVPYTARGMKPGVLDAQGFGTTDCSRFIRRSGRAEAVKLAALGDVGRKPVPGILYRLSRDPISWNFPILSWSRSQRRLPRGYSSWTSIPTAVPVPGMGGKAFEEAFLVPRALGDDKSGPTVSGHAQSARSRLRIRSPSLCGRLIGHLGSHEYYFQFRILCSPIMSGSRT